MFYLTRENAKNHCRTCLVQLNAAEYVDIIDTFSGQNEQKDLINITTNPELEQLITKNINEKGAEQLSEYPKNICLSCCNKVQDFAKFRNRAQDSANKLHSLLCDENMAKLKIEFEDDANKNDDTWKFMFKDTLMETESVMLANAEIANLASLEMHVPDPFEITSIITGEDSEKSEYDYGAWQDDKSSDEHTDNSCNENMTEKRTLRSSTRKQTEKSNVKTKRGTQDKGEELSKTKMLAKAEKSNLPSLDHFQKSCTVAEEETKHSASEKEDNDCKEWQDDNNSDEKSNDSSWSTTNQSKDQKRKLKYKWRPKEEREEARKKKIMNAEKRKERMKHQKKFQKNFKCTQCTRAFLHQITLDAHVRKVHEGNERPYHCDRCDKTYTMGCNLYIHIKEAHGTEVRTYNCDYPDCDRIYTNYGSLQWHKEHKHTPITERKTYICDQCGAIYYRKDHLNKHRSSKHPTEAELDKMQNSTHNFECTSCDKILKTRNSLLAHTMQVHSTGTLYECTVCNRKMAKRNTYLVHMKNHARGDAYACEPCGKRYRRKCNLQEHINRVHLHLRPYACQYCTETFFARKTLRHHEYIHTGEKPYVCDICGAAYRQKYCLKVHRKSHEKPKTETLMAKNLNSCSVNTFKVPP